MAFAVGFLNTQAPPQGGSTVNFQLLKNSLIWQDGGNTVTHSVNGTTSTFIHNGTTTAFIDSATGTIQLNTGTAPAAAGQVQVNGSTFTLQDNAVTQYYRANGTSLMYGSGATKSTVVSTATGVLQLNTGTTPAAAGQVQVNGQTVSFAGTADTTSYACNGNTVKFVDNATTNTVVIPTPGTNSVSATINYAVVTMTPAQVQGMNATPFTLVAAPAAGKSILPMGPVCFRLLYGGTQFSSGGAVAVQYHGGASILGTAYPSATLNAAATSDTWHGLMSTVGVTALQATALEITNGTGAFAGGTGSTFMVMFPYTIQ